jgi:hypothetical protein
MILTDRFESRPVRKRQFKTDQMPAPMHIGAGIVFFVPTQITQEAPNSSELLLTMRVICRPR